jgi:hypothetical protein
MFQHVGFCLVIFGLFNVYIGFSHATLRASPYPGRQRFSWIRLDMCVINCCWICWDNDKSRISSNYSRFIIWNIEFEHIRRAPWSWNATNLACGFTFCDFLSMFHDVSPVWH